MNHQDFAIKRRVPDAAHYRCHLVRRFASWRLFISSTQSPVVTC
jgi:hypothetical protein